MGSLRVNIGPSNSQKSAGFLMYISIVRSFERKTMDKLWINGAVISS